MRSLLVEDLPRPEMSPHDLTLIIIRKESECPKNMGLVAMGQSAIANDLMYSNLNLYSVHNGC